MNEIFFVATLPDFNKAVGIDHEGIIVPLIFTDDLLFLALKHKDNLNEKYSTNSFKLYKAAVDNIEEITNTENRLRCFGKAKPSAAVFW